MGGCVRVVGVNHRTTPIDLREKLAFPSEAIPDALDAFRKCSGAEESVILSTCNRVEVYYAAGEELSRAPSAESFIIDYHHLGEFDSGKLLYRYESDGAVRHLFNVAAGFDSMVVGETQILNQVKESYQLAERYGFTGKTLNRLFQRALSVAKVIHTKTQIHEKAVSIPSVAAKLADKIFSDIASRAVLIVGAGEIGELALQSYKQRGVKRLLVCNRTVETAVELSKRVGGTAYGFDDLSQCLAEADVVISCVNSSRFLTAETIRDIMKKKQSSLFLIDLGLPRNVDPEANAIDNVYLFDIDDLQEIVERNTVEREIELEKGRKIIEDEVGQFLLYIQRDDIGPVIAELHKKLHAIGEEELVKTLAKLHGVGNEEKQEVSYLVKRVVNKVLHDPTVAAKDIQADGKSYYVTELIKKLFRL